MLTIHCKCNFIPERKYIYDVVFYDFWGMDYQIKFEDRQDVLVTDGTDTELRLADTFLQMSQSDWLMEKSLPVQPLSIFNVPQYYSECVTDELLPIIYGDIKYGTLFCEQEKYCCLDIFGAAFFMLTRYEEFVKKERDGLNRFPVKASLAYWGNFLDRPIINEYLEILWKWLSSHFMGLHRKNRQFNVMPTHDVDYPFWSLANDWPSRLRNVVSDVLIRRELSTLATHMEYIKNALVGNYDDDPYNTFGKIMDISEANNLISNFYFMTAQGREGKDGNYNIMHPELRKLAKSMVERGHKIGIHPGFGSKDSGNFIKSDVDRLKKMIAIEKLGIENFGGRQHYLHWTCPDTWSYYESAGIVYDTTLSYADHIGFRCGICYDYPVYDIIKHERYRLREYPLEVMDCSGLSEQYMNLTHEEMIRFSLELKRKVRKYKGTFVILWHNTFFMSKCDVDCYKNILQS